MVSSLQCFKRSRGLRFYFAKKHIRAFFFWLFTDLIQQFIKSLLSAGVVPLYPWTLAYRIVIYHQKKKERFFWWKQRSQPNFQLRKRWLISRYFKSCRRNNCIISFIIYYSILIIYIFYTNIYKFSIEDNCKIVLLLYNYFQNSSLVFRLKSFSTNKMDELFSRVQGYNSTTPVRLVPL